jgi:hypothetical protein
MGQREVVANFLEQANLADNGADFLTVSKTLILA